MLYAQNMNNVQMFGIPRMHTTKPCAYQHKCNSEKITYDTYNDIFQREMNALLQNIAALQ